MSVIFKLNRAPTAGVSCGLCSRKDSCLRAGLTAEEEALLDQAVCKSRPIARGHALFRAGDRSAGLYVVKTGAFKLVHPDPEGEDHVVRFYLPGDLVGLDAVPTTQHPTSALALDTSAACLLPWRAFEDLVRACPRLAHKFLQAAGREIESEQRRLSLIGHHGARERLVGFLQDLSRKYAARGYSATEIRLPMSRYDLGDYLGLATETVSRLFSALAAEGQLTVQQRWLRLHWAPAEHAREPMRRSA
jgi:CRP/FNR family transcriptional regulator